MVSMPLLKFTVFFLVAAALSRLHGQITDFPQFQGEKVDADTALSRLVMH